MKIEALTVALRPRTAWEAVELGTALVRTHAGAVWKPWLLLSVPVLLLLNLLTWSIGAVWLAGLLMWWLKPVFDQSVLFVLSRAVFGDVPGTGAAVAAPWRWGRHWWLPYLTWRRLSPARSLYLPVDLLEGARGDVARQRRSAIGAPVYGVAALLTAVCLEFIAALAIGIVLSVWMFVPEQWLPESARWAGALLESAPDWLMITFNLVAWAATCVIEPFYVGAGLGLYLNRRTEIEAWDIEIVLRRLRTRLTAAAPLALVLVLAVLAAGLLPMAPARAQDAAIAPSTAPSSGARALPVVAPSPGTPTNAPALPPERDESSEDDDAGRVAEAAAAGEEADAAAAAGKKKPRRKAEVVRPPTLPPVFGPQFVDDAGLRKAVKQAYADPSVTPKRKVMRWQPREKDTPSDKKIRNPAMEKFLAALAGAAAAIGEYGLWVLLGLLVLALLVTAPRWLPWLRTGVSMPRRQHGHVHEQDAPPPAPLPEDPVSAIRRLWLAGRARDALALMYRASVAAMSVRADVMLVPGATEAQCLRASRRMPEAADREAFADAVRLWQYAAYAGRLPTQDEFDGVLGACRQRFGWPA
ncbi:DUF4129 domain-containing protein [Montanilutibacter psychrotolerans]|uniref:DUF4129 domain-containing protein n=1 Tax=Montanilutibacter psychrotolerans TaxID=1327343 RepID=A0A3M8SSZ0_9GAMM|nr:DUF4129 domain-containing protein [Lysobacter psychrotolerans]RNF83815.1 DUF4129 domain-containing protein [Lysobacter psychrotolerans]